MDPIVFIPSASLGLTMAVVYCGRRIAKKQRIEVGTLVSTVLNSAGVVAGTLLVASTFSEPIRKAINDIELYIIISGLVVLGVSLQSLMREIFGENRPRQPPPGD